MGYTLAETQCKELPNVMLYLSRLAGAKEHAIGANLSLPQNHVVWRGGSNSRGEKASASYMGAIDQLGTLHLLRLSLSAIE